DGIRDFHVTGVQTCALPISRGVDVGAIEFIHAQLRRAREAGRAILLVSADLNEVLALSDRIGVLYGGRLVCLLDRSEASAEILRSEERRGGKESRTLLQTCF